MNDDIRDPLDAAIAHDLAPLAPDDIDADATLGALRPSLQRARSRHRLAVASTAVGALVFVVGLGGLIAGSRSSHISVQGHSTTTVPAASTSTPTTRKVTPTSTTTTTGPGSGNTSSTVAGSTGNTPTSTPANGSTPTTTGHGGGGGPPATAPHGSTTTTTAPSPQHTYVAIGGTITITFENGQITLYSYAAASGYTTEIKSTALDDIEVRFTNGSAESRIRIRVQNGVLVKEIIEK